jgi:hypothetical protein
MESRQRIPRKLTRRVGERAVETPVGGAAFSMPHIAELIDSGQITVGVMEPVGCVAVASQDGNTLAQLQRRKGETFLQLLTRLDQAVDNALTSGIFTDEINP